MKKKMLILVLCLVLIISFGCKKQIECQGHINDKGECIPTTPPGPPIIGPPAGELSAIVIEILDYENKYEKSNSFAILKIEEINCVNCFNKEYPEIKIGNELIFSFYDTTKPVPKLSLPGIKIGDKIKVDLFSGVENAPYNIPKTDLKYTWEVIEYNLI